MRQTRFLPSWNSWSSRENKAWQWGQQRRETMDNVCKCHTVDGAGCLTQTAEWRKFSGGRKHISVNYLKWPKCLKGPTRPCMVWTLPYFQLMTSYCFSYSSCSETEPLSILGSLRTFVHAFLLAWNFLLSHLENYSMKFSLNITSIKVFLCPQD